ncbi:MAG: hypothetical protein CSA24_01145 [Deltaproteobacteria bacterium]|nr:MAG: hypothetical protein CSA24_01145 [Deltaproteobacteria bacterium]
MSERGLEIKVGILVTVTVALLVMFVLLLGDFSMSSGSEILLDVETSAALKPGAPVKIAGVPAGRVVDVDYRGGELDPAVGRPVFVRVTLRVDDDKLATLRRDARFYITNQGVLGEKYVEIEPVSHEGPVAQPGEVFEGEPPMRLEIMASDAGRVLSSIAGVLRRNEQAIEDIIVDTSATMKIVKRAVGRADALLADNSPKIGEVIDQLLVVEAEVKALAASAREVLGDGREIRAALDNVAALSSELRRAVGPVVRQVRGTLDKYATLAITGQALVADAQAKAESTLAGIAQVIDDAKTVTGRIRDGRGTVGALLSDQEMYDDIREMMKDLKRHPWKFIWKE